MQGWASRRIEKRQTPHARSHKRYYLHQQACCHRTNQPVRDNFILQLLKDAQCVEFAAAEAKTQDPEGLKAFRWPAQERWWKENDRLAAYHMQLKAKYEEEKAKRDAAALVQPATPPHDTSDEALCVGIAPGRKRVTNGRAYPFVGLWKH